MFIKVPGPRKYRKLAQGVLNLQEDVFHKRGCSLHFASLEDAWQIARVHVDTWRSQYQGIISQSFLDNLSYENRESMWISAISQGHEKWHLYLVKNHSGLVVGFCCGGKNRSELMDFDAEVYSIYIKKDYQGLGIGRALFSNSLAKLAADGFKSCLLWVLEKNPSRNFYEIMGGQLLGQKMVQIGEQTCKEVSYGWSNLAGCR